METRLILILMIKNESSIIERCLSRLQGVVADYVVSDTGSTDNTCELVDRFLSREGVKGTLHHTDWVDFGTNRTRSFIAAKKYVEKCGYPLDRTYGVLLDADMLLVVGDNFKASDLSAMGYKIQQVNGDLVYYNTRIVRFDYDWRCLGVTHEYWDGPNTIEIDPNILSIDDRNDGGCKSDKFTRDRTLLERGLEQEPTNVRYMFYLAQTYKDLSLFAKAIKMYKRRIKAGGWVEEVWYSMYMIGSCWRQLGKIVVDSSPEQKAKCNIEAERWMQLAYNYRPCRAEPIYSLCKYFREDSEHHKAYAYLKKGLEIVKGYSNLKDLLFVEKSVYDHLFLFEKSILDYYVSREDGMYSSLEYLLQYTQPLENKRVCLDNWSLTCVYNNLIHYTKRLNSESVSFDIFNLRCSKSIQMMDFPKHLVKGLVSNDYNPSSICIFLDSWGKIGYAVRMVNYTIDRATGSYLMCVDGVISGNNQVRTETIYVRDGTVELLENRHTDTSISGYEDIRVFCNSNDELVWFGSIANEYPKISIATGKFEDLRRRNNSTIVLKSPLDSICEKNWVPVDGTEDVIYSWHPLRVGRVTQGSVTIIDGNVNVVDPTLKFHTTYQTPYLFSHIRGSSPAIQIGNEYWAVVHYVYYTTPRKYFHAFVRLGVDYHLKSISKPFVFEHAGVEYCLGCIAIDGGILCSYSIWDSTPKLVCIPFDNIEWLSIL